MCLLQKVLLNPKMVLGVAEVPEFLSLRCFIYILLTDIYLVVIFTEFRFFFKSYSYSLQRLENRHLVEPVPPDETTPTMKGTLSLEKNWIAPVFTTGFEKGRSKK